VLEQPAAESWQKVSEPVPPTRKCECGPSNRNRIELIDDRIFKYRNVHGD